MTTYFTRDAACAACGKNSPQQTLGSTNQFGSRDLDLRPPEMARSTMHAWIYRCPHCRYCAPNLSEAGADVNRLLGEDEYVRILDDARFPELARMFLAWSWLNRESQPLDAARARLHAAWVCDDAGDEFLACECRNLAVECYDRLRPFRDQPDATARAVLVDVLRRADRLAEAAQECDALLGVAGLEPPVRAVLEFQAELIRRRDGGVYRIDRSAGLQPSRRR